MFNQMPYMMSSPMSMMPTSSTLGTASKASLLGKINWSSLLSNAQKTLNVVNQAIPLYYQVKPVFNNIKTIGKIGREMTKMASSNNVTQNNNVNNIADNSNNKIEENNNIIYDNNENIPNPTFFL